jgi:hypothetical protein
VIRVRPSLVSIMRSPRIARTKTSIGALRARIVPPARKFLLGLGHLPPGIPYVVVPGTLRMANGVKDFYDFLATVKGMNPTIDIRGF